VAIYDVPCAHTPLYLTPFLTNIKSGFHLESVPSVRIFFKMKNLQKLGFQMELLLSNSELSVILMILPNDHQHILQPQRMFENLAKLYAKRVRMYARAKPVTDTPVKNALTRGGLEQTGKELC
jgi:hypothetical protein